MRVATSGEWGVKALSTAVPWIGPGECPRIYFLITESYTIGGSGNKIWHTANVWNNSPITTYREISLIFLKEVLIVPVFLISVTNQTYLYIL